jgi:hypothetical protein
MKDKVNSFIKEQISKGYIEDDPNLEDTIANYLFSLDDKDWEKFIERYVPFNPEREWWKTLLSAGLTIDHFATVISLDKKPDELTRIKISFHLVNIIILVITIWLILEGYKEFSLSVYFGWNFFVSISVKNVVRARNSCNILSLVTDIKKEL